MQTVPFWNCDQVLALGSLKRLWRTKFCYWLLNLIVYKTYIGHLSISLDVSQEIAGLEWIPSMDAFYSASVPLPSKVTRKQTFLNWETLAKSSPCPRPDSHYSLGLLERFSCLCQSGLSTLLGAQLAALSLPNCTFQIRSAWDTPLITDYHFYSPFSNMLLASFPCCLLHLFFFWSSFYAPSYTISFHLFYHVYDNPVLIRIWIVKCPLSPALFRKHDQIISKYGGCCAFIVEVALVNVWLF